MALDLSALPSASSLLQGRSNQPKSSGLLETLMETIAGVGDPLSQQMVKSLLEDDLGIKIPSPEELQLQEINQRQVMRAAQKADAIAAVDEVTNAALSAGARDDFMEDPDRFIQVNEELRRAGVVNFVLDRGQLRAGGLPSAQTSAEQREAQRLSRQTGALEGAEKLAEQTTDGSGFLQQALDSALEGVAASTEARTGSGVNLGTGMFTDIDETGGSQALFEAYEVFQSGVEGIADREVAADAFLARFGDEFVDQLEGLQPDENGQLIVGGGDSGVTGQATTFLTVLLANIAEDTGRPLADLMAELGLGYTGVNQESFQAAIGQAMSAGDLTVSSSRRAGP